MGGGFGVLAREVPRKGPPLTREECLAMLEAPELATRHRAAWWLGEVGARRDLVPLRLAADRAGQDLRTGPASTGGAGCGTADVFETFDTLAPFSDAIALLQLRHGIDVDSVFSNRLHADWIADYVVRTGDSAVFDRVVAHYRKWASQPHIAEAPARVLRCVVRAGRDPWAQRAKECLSRSPEPIERDESGDVEWTTRRVDRIEPEVRTISGYELVRLRDTLGVFELWEASHLCTGKKVLVLLLPPEHVNKENGDRLFTEARSRCHDATPATLMYASDPDGTVYAMLTWTDRPFSFLTDPRP